MTESKIQQNICQYLSMISNRYKFVFFSVPNESLMMVLKMFKVPDKSCYAIVAFFKKMGLLPGTSDIVLVWHGMTYCMEVKTPTGTQSPAQKLFESNILKAGGKYEIVRSACDVQKILRVWEIIN